MAEALLDLDTLSDEERIDLAVALWESVGKKGRSLPLTPGQAKELDRRVAAYRTDGGSGIPWRESIQRIENRR